MRCSKIACTNHRASDSRADFLYVGAPPPLGYPFALSISSALHFAHDLIQLFISPERAHSCTNQGAER